MGISVFVLLLWLSPTTAFVPYVGDRQVIMGPRARKSSTGQVRMATASFNGANVKATLASNRARVESLASVSPDVPEITRLRFALAFPDNAEAASALRETVAWRRGAGRSIVDKAAEAVTKATAGGGWDNEAVALAAPHATTINQFITSKSILTLSTDAGPLVRHPGVRDR